jgi:flagellar protein FlaI
MDSVNRDLPANGKNTGLGVSLSPVPSLEIEGLKISEELLSEVARDYMIDDVSLLQEVLAEISKGGVNGNVLGETRVLTQYHPADFQNVRVKAVDGASLLYEASEPVLDQKELKALGLIKNVFDRFIGAEESVMVSDAAVRRKYLWERFEEITKLYNIKVSPEQKHHIFYFIERDFLKYGIIDVIMSDRHIEDVSCNGPNLPIYIYHREYGSVKTNIRFEEQQLNEFILRLSQLCGKHISILNPIMDAALPDGSRINMTLGSEVTKKGSSFTIRKFKKVPISPVELMGFGSVDSQLLSYIWMMMDYSRSLLVSGGTASGKTTFLNAISMFIRPQNKIVSIEDTPEINLEHPNWLQSVSRSGFGGQSGGGSPSGMSSMPSGISHASSGSIGLFDLLIAALRQRPEYIIVGEVRGAEAFTMFQAIAVGHACMGTIHARNMSELLGRVESVPMNVPRTLFSNVDLVVFVSQVKAGEKTIRRVLEIIEVLELDPNNKALITNPSFRWDPKTDKFEAGRFMLFDKIAGEYGINLKSLIDEYNRRVRFLDWLKKNSIKTHIEVTRHIVAYTTGQLGDRFLEEKNV